MSTTETRTDFLGELRAAIADLPRPAHGGHAMMRDLADSVLDGQRLPSLKDEAWRFTPLTALTSQRFVASQPQPRVLTADIGRFLLPEAEGARLVFVNGVFDPKLSCVKELPPGVLLAPLGEAPEGSLRRLGQLAAIDDDVFTALNARGWADGALVSIGTGVALAQPLQIIHVGVATETPVLSSPRLLVVLGQSAEATLVEEFVCVNEGVSLTNAVAEIALSENASLHHCRVQSESRQAVHIARAVVTLARDARYTVQSVTLGARLSRFNLDVLQQGPDTCSQIDGLALIAGQQEADTHTSLDHAYPRGQSTQLHKCIVDDEAHAVFNGRIEVRQAAQLTDSSQASRNLLLSDKARVDTKPELMIHADDVKCAHGAAIGQIDADELFYLRSRGLHETAARDLLAYAFAAEVIDRVPVPSLRRQLREVVGRQTDKSRKGAS